jgi:L-amino acid N-acyltransferase YncA
MELTFEPISVDARHAVVDIFNYYVENSFSAYPEHKVPYEFFDAILNMCKGYPSTIVKNEDGEIIGFGMLRPFNPIPTFSRTAEITYFLKPGFTGQGVGKAILDFLTNKGREKGLSSILASISSLNEGSIRFHLKNGFSECGRLKSIGLKNGTVFDVVYYQRML